MIIDITPRSCLRFAGKAGKLAFEILVWWFAMQAAVFGLIGIEALLHWQPMRFEQCDWVYWSLFVGMRIKGIFPKFF